MAPTFRNHLTTTRASQHRAGSEDERSTERARPLGKSLGNGAPSGAGSQLDRGGEAGIAYVDNLHSRFSISSSP